MRYTAEQVSLVGAGGVDGGVDDARGVVIDTANVDWVVVAVQSEVGEFPQSIAVEHVYTPIVHWRTHTHPQFQHCSSYDLEFSPYSLPNVYQP